MSEPIRFKTKSQRKLVELVGGRGLSYAEAAIELGLTVRTVEFYAQEIRALAGLACSPRAALFLLYRELPAEEHNGNGKHDEA